MDILPFLRLVLPATGIYANFYFPGGKTAKGKDKCTSVYHHNLQALADSCIEIDTRKHGVSFTVATLRGKTWNPKFEKELYQRREIDVVSIKTFCMDIDCGENKPYPTWEEGLTALARFVQKTGLPAPMVVRSGNGLHVYWPLLNPIQPEQWEPLAEGLRQLTELYGLKTDASVITNCAVGLRPPQSHNPKNGREVEVIIPCDPIPLGVIEPKLRALGVGREFSSPLLDSMKTEKEEYEPVNGAKIMSACQQVSWCVNNSETLSEPLWRALMGVAAVCIDKEKIAVEWSMGHPDFTHDGAIEKMEAWANATGGAPPLCETFAKERPKGCKGCPHKGIVRTPAALGRTYKEVEPTLPTVMKPPKPYKLTKDGIKVTIEGSDTEVCDFHIHPISYGYDESLGYEVVRCTWERKHRGWVPITLRLADLSQGNVRFSDVLADQGILIPEMFKRGQFQAMMGAYIRKLIDEQPMNDIYATYGWKENNTVFVMGDKTYSVVEGKVVEERIVKPTARLGTEGDPFDPAGSQEAWLKLTEMIDEHSLTGLGFGIGVGLSAPLYTFGGLKGIIISLYGETGSGKTLSQMWAQSIYGDPDKLHFTSNYTLNSLWQRLGVQNNLPMTVDESTMMSPQDTEHMIYLMSQGTNKHRLKSDSKPQDLTTWATPAMLSTNKSLMSKLAGGSYSVDALQARLLEVNMGRPDAFSEGASNGAHIHDTLRANYGHIGKEFIKKLLEIGDAGIRKLLDDAEKAFPAKYGHTFAGQERYWRQAIITADLAMELASKWGLIKFDPRPITEWVLNEITGIRGIIEEAAVTPADMLAEYVKEQSSKMLVMTSVIGSGKNDFGDPNRLPRNGIEIRVELYRKDRIAPHTSGSMYVGSVEFSRWVAHKTMDYNTFKKYMGSALIPSSKGGYTHSVVLGKGSGVKTLQSYALRFDLTHPLLKGMLDETALKSVAEGVDGVKDAGK